MVWLLLYHTYETLNSPEFLTRDSEVCQNAYNWTGETNYKYIAFPNKSTCLYMNIWGENPCKLLGIEHCSGNSGEGEINTDCHR